MTVSCIALRQFEILRIALLMTATEANGFLNTRTIHITIFTSYVVYSISTCTCMCATNPALYNDKLVNQCAARSGSPCDDKSSH